MPGAGPIGIKEISAASRSRSITERIHVPNKLRNREEFPCKTDALWSSSAAEVAARAVGDSAQLYLVRHRLSLTYFPNYSSVMRCSQTLYFHIR